MLNPGDCAYRRARPPIRTREDALEVIRDAATVIESNLPRMHPEGRLYPVAIEMVRDLRDAVDFLDGADRDVHQTAQFLASLRRVS